MSARLLLWTTLAVAAASTLHVRAAQACSGSCWPAALLPAGGTTLPQNVPGFPFRAARNTMFGNPDTGLGIESVTLKDADGKTVDTRIDVVQPAPAMMNQHAFDRLIVPSSPLPPGKYTIEYQEGCVTGGLSTRAVSLGDAKPFPTELGTLEAVRSTQEKVKVFGSAGCIDEYAADSVKIILHPTPELAPFEPVTVFDVLVDGNRWTGPVSSFVAPGWVHTADPFTVLALCEPYPSIARGQIIGSGKHLVEVRGRIEGAPSELEPVSIEVELDCSRFASDGGADASAGDADASAGDAAPNTEENSVDADPENDESSSCSSTSNGRIGASGIVFTLAVTALFARARRRRTL